MATISVEATWRMARAEINLPYNYPGTVNGYGEILLQEPTADPKTYGSLPSPPITRQVDAVLDDKVDVDGQTLSFSTLMQAFGAFFEKWRLEDEAKPPPAPPAPMPGSPPVAKMPV